MISNPKTLLPDAQIIFQSPIGSLKLASKFVTRARLQKLFALDDLVVVTPDGEEIKHDSDGTYRFTVPACVVVSEDDIGRADEELKFDEAMVREHFRRSHAMVKARRELIQELYAPKHPHLYQFEPERFLVPSYLAAIKDGSHEALMAILKKETHTGIYSFDMLQQKFCEELIDEVENFEQSGLPIIRPNSMNNYGLILDEIGFESWLDRLMRECIMPFSKMLYPKFGGDSLDHHHGFVVKYKIGEDTNLDFHFDDSEVTLNVCLGKQFQGGSLFFKGLLHDESTHMEHFEFQHTRGRAIFHLGKHRHGAHDIQSGSRYNLILWARSSAYRQAHPPPCRCGHEHHTQEVEDHHHADGHHCGGHGHEHGHEHEHEHQHSDC